MHRPAQVLLEADCAVDPEDKMDQTPLHLACKRGHKRMVEILLKWKADVTHRTVDGRNPLDFAIDFGHASCARVILEDEKWREAMKNSTKDFATDESVNTPIRKLIARMPDVAELVFTKCMKEEGMKDSDNYKITFNYEILEDDSFCKKWCENNAAKPEDQANNSEDQANNTSRDCSWFSSILFGPAACKWNHPLQVMVQSKREKLLRHPLVVSLLNYKWRAYARAFYAINLFTYLLFLGIFNSYMLTMPPPYSIDAMNVTSSCVAIISQAQPIYGECYDYNAWGSIAKIFVIVLAIFGLVKEVYQLYTKGLSYFLNFTNYLEIAIYTMAILTVYSDYPAKEGFDYQGIREIWQWQVGSISIFLSWMGLIMFIQNLPVVGMFVLMFKDVLMTFMKFFLVFIFFLFGFAFSFHCLLQNQYAFQQWWSSVIKTSVMMIGEFDMGAIFNAEAEAVKEGAGNQTITASTVNYRAATYILFIFFLIISSIIIMNLLVGLAVDDIKAIQENAELKRLAMQVQLLLDVDNMLPEFIRKKFIMKERTFSPNIHKKRSFWVRWYHSEDNLNHTTIRKALNPEKTEMEEIENELKKLQSRVKSLKHKLDSDLHETKHMVHAIVKHFKIECDQNKDVNILKMQH